MELKRDNVWKVAYGKYKRISDYLRNTFFIFSPEVRNLEDCSFSAVICINLLGIDSLYHINILKTVRKVLLYL